MPAGVRAYIIEHPRRGILVDLETTESGWQVGRFSPTKHRTEAMAFSSLLSAMNARVRVRPYTLQGECKVMRRTTDGWEKVA